MGWQSEKGNTLMNIDSGSGIHYTAFTRCRYRQTGASKKSITTLSTLTIDIIGKSVYSFLYL